MNMAEFPQIPTDSHLDINEGVIYTSTSKVKGTSKKVGEPRNYQMRSACHFMHLEK